MRDGTGDGYMECMKVLSVKEVFEEVGKAGGG